MALGLNPPAIRHRIITGELAAARVGRRWRVHIDSVNALLVAKIPTRNSPLPVRRWAAMPTKLPLPPESRSPTLTTSVVAPTPVVPISPQIPDQPSPKPLFSDADLRHIAQLRAELWNPDPATRAQAEDQLRMFAQSVERDPTRRAEAGLTIDRQQVFLTAMQDQHARLPLPPPPPPPSMDHIISILG